MVKLDEGDFFVLRKIICVWSDIAKDLLLVKNFLVAAEGPG